MRRFLVTLCCVIVAIQILVGVPLAVCIGFLSLVEFSPATVPPVPASYSPAPVDFPAYPPIADVCMPPPLTNLAPIVESRAQHGSPLAESSLAAASPEEELHLFATALEDIAKGEAAAPLPESTVPVETSPQPVAASPAPDNPSLPADDSGVLLASLGASAEHLYALAERHEADGEYGRADQVRQLARDIRDEMDLIRRSQPGSEPTVWGEPMLPATTVTEASFNPEPPPPPAPAQPPPPVPTEPVPSLSPPTLPQ